MKPVIGIHEVSVLELKNPDRSHRLLIDPDQLKAKNLSMGMCVVGPHGSISYHTHSSSEEAIFVYAGKGRVKMGESTYDFDGETAIFATPGVPHQIVNTGDSELRFVYVYSPPGEEQAIKQAAKKTAK